jgi:hypothetical protein
VASGDDADTISIDDAIFADWASLLAASSQSGSDVLITANTSDSILIKNLGTADLHQNNFAFT